MGQQNRQFRFTKESLSKLEPSDRRMYFRDDKEPRLWVTVQTTGKLTFFAQCTVEGRTRRIGIPNGAFPAMTVETARIAALKIASSVASGADPVQERRAKRATNELASLTVEDAVKAFCAGKVRRLSNGEKLPIKESTAADYKKKIKALLGADLYGKPLIDLDEDTIAKRVAASSRTTGAAACRSLSSVWNWTAKQKEYRGKLPPNPVKEFAAFNEGLHVSAPRDRRLRNEHFPAFLAAVEALPAVSREAVLWLCLTGNRVSEAEGLDWQDIDFRHSEYVLRDTKNRRPATLPIPSTLIQPLRMRRKESGRVFPLLIRKPVEACAAVIGEKLSPHDLRRTHAGLCAAVLPETSGKRLQNRVLHDVFHQYIGSSANLHDELAKVERLFYSLAGKPLKNVKHLEAVK